MKKLLLVFTVLMLVLVGCGKKVLNQKELAMSLVGKKVYISHTGMWTGEKKFVIDNIEEIKEIKLIKRKTLKEEQLDLAYVNLIFEKNGVEISGTFVIKSVLFDKGWEVDKAELEENTEVEYKVVSGIKEKGLKDLFAGATVKYTEVNYLRIKKDAVIDIKILSQETNLELLEDHIVFEAEFENKGMIVREKMDGKFKFEKGKWIPNKIIALEQISYKEKDRKLIDMELVKKFLEGSKIQLTESDKIYGMNKFKGVYWDYTGDEVEKINIKKIENVEYYDSYREIYLDVKLNNQFTKSEGIIKFMCKYENDEWKKMEDSFKGIKFAINHPEKTIEDMKKDLIGKRFFYKGLSSWTIEKGEIKNCKISKRDRQGDREIVVLNIELVGKEYKCKGDLKLEYNYGKMGWRLSSIYKNGKEFTKVKL